MYIIYMVHNIYSIVIFTDDAKPAVSQQSLLTEISIPLSKGHHVELGCSLCCYINKLLNRQLSC